MRERIGFFLCRAAAGAAAAALAGIATASAAEISINAAQLAPKLEPLFRETVLYLNNASRVPSGRWDDPSLNADGSYLQLARPLPRIRKIIRLQTRRVEVPMGDRIKKTFVFYNTEPIGVSGRSVAAADGAFVLTLHLQQTGSAAGLFKCFIGQAGNRPFTPCDESTSYTLQQGAVRVRLLPTLRSGGVALRIGAVELSGRLVNASGTCSPTATDPRSVFCRSVRETYLQMVGAAVKQALEEAFADERVQNIIALWMTGPLREMGFTGRVAAVRMDGRNLILTK